MTKDLASLVGKEQEWQTTDEFLDTLSENLAKKIAAK
jgi:isocitrate dehydrogenase